MKKTHSVKKIVIRYFSILMTVVVICLFLCSGYSIWVYQQLQYCNEATQVVVRNNLINTLEALSEFNQEISSNDVNFMILSYESNQITVQQKMESQYQLRRMIINRVPSFGAILLFNRSASVFFYRFGRQCHGSLLTQPDIQYMHMLYSDLVTQPDNRLNQWQIYDQDGVVFLVNTYRLRDLYICSMLDLTAFSEACVAGTDNIHYVFYSDDQILTNRDYAASQQLSLEKLKMPSANYSPYPCLRDLVETEYFPEYGIGLASIIPITGVWNYTRMYIVISIGTLFVVCLTFSAIYSILHRVLIYPLNEITVASRRLANFNETEPEENTDLEEFTAIRTALNHLVEQKVQLTIENENRLQEKNHALLQYYQLQTRSHFFLNCLKSLYSMTEKGKTENTKRMILCFSNHLRYIFHDTLSLVTLEAELAEVNDYYQIIQLDRQTPILLDVEVPEELILCRVPPLTIQTFVENSYKYNNDGSKLLRFRIQADRVTLEEKAFLRLRLSDNGKGYSPEVLESLKGIGEAFEIHHVGIKNLRRRIGILFDGDYQIAFLNGHDGGAMTVIYLPIEKGEKS